jgi:hypothetical protein
MEDLRFKNIHSEQGFFDDRSCSQFANVIVKFFQDPANMAEFKVWQAKRRKAKALERSEQGVNSSILGA